MAKVPAVFFVDMCVRSCLLSALALARLEAACNVSDQLNSVVLRCVFCLIFFSIFPTPYSIIIFFLFCSFYAFACAYGLDAALLNFYVVMCFLPFNSTIFLKSVDLLFDYRRYEGTNNKTLDRPTETMECVCVFSVLRFFSLSLSLSACFHLLIWKLREKKENTRSEREE